MTSTTRQEHTLTTTALAALIAAHPAWASAAWAVVLWWEPLLLAADRHPARAAVALTVACVAWVAAGCVREVRRG